MHAVKFYEELFERLRLAGVTSLEDLDDIEANKNGFYASYDHGWVRELYRYVELSGGPAFEEFATGASIPIYFGCRFLLLMSSLSTGSRRAQTMRVCSRVV